MVVGCLSGEEGECMAVGCLSGEEGQCMAVGCWRGEEKGVHGCYLLEW